MGMIKCNKHGLSGIYSDIDKTILKLIWNEKPMMGKKVFRVEGILKDEYGEDEYDWIFNFYINSKLFYALNLKKKLLIIYR